MNPHLPDLRTQRDLVKRHLDWLDARIAETDGAAAPQTNPMPAAETPAAAAEEPHGEAVAEKIISGYAGGEEILTPAAKNGCIFAAMAFIILFLLVLFGLPYVLYKDKHNRTPAGTHAEP